MKLRSQLNVTVPSMGRFGTTISSLADLNGDGLRDVAVGAPLEDNNSGAVYIYIGDRHNGIHDLFSQVRKTMGCTIFVVVETVLCSRRKNTNFHGIFLHSLVSKAFKTLM